MWLKHPVNIGFAALSGGFVASLIAPHIGGVFSWMRLDNPFGAALGMLPFTLIGVFSVASLFNWLNVRGASARRAYIVTLMFGAFAGGIMVLGALTSVVGFGIGAFFGFTTAATWAVINRYLLPAF